MTEDETFPQFADIPSLELKQIIVSQKNEIFKLRKQLVDIEAKYDNRPKLTARDVELIRRFDSTTGMSHRELARVFNVNERTIGRTLEGVYHKGK